MQTNPTPYFYNARYLKSIGISQDVYAPEGRLLNDLTNRIRLGVTATISLPKGGEITLSWMGRYSDGQPYGSVNFGNNAGVKLGADPTNGWAGWGLSDLTAGTNNTVVARGAKTQVINGYIAGRRPFEQNALGTVDFRASFKVPLQIWKMQVFGDLIISNFFNHADMGYNTSFNTVYSSDYQAGPTLTAGSNFGAPGANGDYRQHIAPRTVAASLGMRF